jgi:hypothetical protein
MNYVYILYWHQSICKYRPQGTHRILRPVKERLVGLPSPGGLIAEVPEDDSLHGRGAEVQAQGILQGIGAPLHVLVRVVQLRDPDGKARARYCGQAVLEG